MALSRYLLNLRNSISHLDELGEHARGIPEMRESVVSIEGGGPLVQGIHHQRAPIWAEADRERSTASLSSIAPSPSP